MSEPRPNILFLVGTPNQTTQMHQIARYLPEANCWFSPYYADSAIINRAIGWRLLDHTILAGHFQQNALAYLNQHQLAIDLRGRQNQYDLVVTCCDLLVQKQLRATRSLWVQEGMVDPVTPLTRLVKALRLPRYLAVGTSLNGASNLCDVYCVASEGYRDFFARMGTDPDKLFVTGIPNYDDLARHRDNCFPYRDYVMVATTDMRETFRPEDRPAFIRQCMVIAAGRRLLFKLHPNEIRERAETEIRLLTPADTLVFQEGDTHAMIANCTELITQYSTVVYAGLAMGKRVHSYYDLASLHQQMPIQNGGRSAEAIADLCRSFLAFGGQKQLFAQSYSPLQLTDHNSSRTI